MSVFFFWKLLDLTLVLFGIDKIYLIGFIYFGTLTKLNRVLAFTEKNNQ